MTDSIEARLRSSDAGAAQDRADAPPPSPVLPCRQGRWVEIELVGQDGKTIPGVAYELAGGASGPVCGKTRAEGPTRVEGLEEGAWKVTFPGLDEEAWCAKGAEPPPPAERAVAASIEIGQGDCVHAIAVTRGFFAGTILALAANRKLVDGRRTAGVLYPGDTLALPALKAKALPVALQQNNVFERKGVPLLVRIRFEGEADEPVKYLLEIDGVAEGGTLAEASVVEVLVEAGATEGSFRLKDGQQHTVRIGHLDPVTTDSGVKSRLIHLAYLLPQSQAGGADVDAERAFRAALRLFQDNNDLEATGEADPATCDKLLLVHGC